MGMHTTIHGKNSTPANGVDGTWQPIKVNAAGQLEIATLNGELSQFNRLAGGAVASYTQISTSTTTVVSTGPCILYGINVTTAGTGSTVTLYDNTAASGTKLIDGAITTARGILNDLPNSIGVLLTAGLTVVTTGATPAVVNVFYAPSV